MQEQQAPTGQSASNAAGNKSAIPLKAVLAAIILIVLIAGAVVWRRHAAAASAGAANARGGVPPITVVAGVVTQKDVAIYLDGLGTVQAFNTVTVHSQVDGKLQKIAFIEGQDVRAGDLLAQIDPASFQAQYEQAVAKKGQDEAQLANARAELKRDSDLLAAKILAQADYDAQKASADQYEAAVRADEAAMDNARVQLDYTAITAPIDGRTGIRQLDAGNIVHANDANGLVVITQLRPISVVFTLPEQTLGQIHRAENADALTVLATDRDNRKILGEGKLAVIDNQIDTTTGTLRLKATFPNDDLRLWPGQFVNTRLLVATRTNGVVVPEGVIQRGPQGAFAFVIDADATAQMRPVKVVQIQDGLALIEDGLKPGETVVVDGQYKLQAGSKIRTSADAGRKSGGPASKPSS